MKDETMMDLGILDIPGVPDVDEPVVDDNDTQIGDTQVDPKVAEYEAKVKDLQAQFDAMKKAQEGQQKAQDTPAQPQEPVYEEPQLKLPDKPKAPERPVNFSQTEAFSDPSSESAKYILAKLEYQDEVSQWNTMVTANVASYYEQKLDGLTKAIAGSLKEQRDNLERKTVYDNAISSLQREHGLTYQQSRDFIDKMQNADSVSLADLVSIYKNREGLSSANEPSLDFIQSQRSQSHTTPISNQNTRGVDTMPAENKILRNIINNANKVKKLY